MSDDKQAQEIVDEMAQRAALEPFMKRDPATLTEDDIRKMVEIHRQQRAAFIAKGGK